MKPIHFGRDVTDTTDQDIKEYLNDMPNFYVVETDVLVVKRCLGIMEYNSRGLCYTLYKVNNNVSKVALSTTDKNQLMLFLSGIKCATMCGD